MIQVSWFWELHDTDFLVLGATELKFPCFYIDLRGASFNEGKYYFCRNSTSESSVCLVLFFLWTWNLCLPEKQTEKHVLETAGNTGCVCLPVSFEEMETHHVPHFLFEIFSSSLLR